MEANSDMGTRLMAAVSQDMTDEEFAAAFSPEGLARHTDWLCEDQWIVGYTTERIRGGKLAGKFAAFSYKPVGKGSQSGKAEKWERNYMRAYSTRKAAKSRATALFYRHSPKAAERHGVAVTA